MKKQITLYGLLFLVLFTWPALAQTPAATPPPAPEAVPAPPREEPEINARDLAELVMAVKLTKELGLNDEQTILMVRKLSDFRDQMNALRKERQQAAKELRNAIQAKEPEPQIESRLNALITLDDKTANFRKERFAKLSEGLSPNKRAILYIFVNDFENEMKQLVQKVKERREQLMGESKERLTPSPEIRERAFNRIQERLGNGQHREEGRVAPPERKQ